MEEIVNRHENYLGEYGTLIDFIKGVITKYCPYTDDRLDMLGNALAPQMDIEIDIKDDSTYIQFMYGNEHLKKSVPEDVKMPKPIDFNEIFKMMDFVFSDHFVIYEFLNNESETKLEFVINWCNEALKGLTCNAINLNIRFANKNYENNFLMNLFQKYDKKLELSKNYLCMKSEFITNNKRNYFDFLNREEILTFLNGMDENELKDLLYNLDNNVYLKYVEAEEKNKPAKRL